MSDLERLGESLRAAMRQRNEAYREVLSLKKENGNLKDRIVRLVNECASKTVEIARLQRIPLSKPHPSVGPNPKGEPRK